jgi:hypothetical protein
MRSLPDRHFVTNPRKKHALLAAILASGKYGPVNSMSFIWNDNMREKREANSNAT